MTGEAQFEVDPRILCPVTQEVCPARASLVRLYTEPVDASVAEHLPPEVSPQRDGFKLQLRLREYDVRAQSNHCPGPDEEICPTRMVMDALPIRRGFVKKVRQVLGKSVNHGN